MSDQVAVESVGVVEAPEVPILREDAPVEEVQPVRSLPPEPEAPPKFLGEFTSEDEARAELERLRGFREAVARDKDVQTLIQQRKAAEQAEREAQLAMQAEEKALLERYTEAVASGDPNKALLTLVRDIRGQANRDAQLAIRRELDQVAEPLRAKQQLIESQNWTDLHPLSDEAVWLATEMGKLGYSKPDVANFLRRVGQKYAGAHAPAQQSGRGRKNQGWGLESPDAGGSLSKVTDKEWDKVVDSYWKEQGY